MSRLLPLCWLLMSCGSLSAPGDPRTPGGDVGTSPTGTGSGTGSIGPDGCQAVGEQPDGGQTCELALDLLPPIDDSGAPVQILTGNLHAPGDVDWYVINAVDTPGDEDRQYEDFDLQLRISTGEDVVQMHVFRGDCLEAGKADTEPGDDEFTFFSEDITADETGSIPDDPRACGAPGTVFNECTDYTGPYLVRVSSISGDTVCDNYVIDVSNGS